MTTERSETVSWRKRPSATARRRPIDLQAGITKDGADTWKSKGRRRQGANMGHNSAQYCRSCTNTVHLIQGKWKMHILCAIRAKPVRLGQLARDLPEASKKVLTENLRELEDAGLVIRRDLGGSIRHVEYDLKEELRPAIQSMLDHLADFGAALGEPSVKPMNGVGGPP